MDEKELNKLLYLLATARMHVAGNPVDWQVYEAARQLTLRLKYAADSVRGQQ